MSEGNTITLYILTEKHLNGNRKITGCSTSKELAAIMLHESFYGEMKAVEVPCQQWERIVSQLQTVQDAYVSTDVQLNEDLEIVSDE